MNFLYLIYISNCFVFFNRYKKLFLKDWIVSAANFSSFNMLLVSLIFNEIYSKLIKKNKPIILETFNLLSLLTSFIDLIKIFAAMILILLF